MSRTRSWISPSNVPKTLTTDTRRPIEIEGAACTSGCTVGGTKPVLWTCAAVLAVVLSEPVWGRWLA
jgi:hypothetical protein